MAVSFSAATGLTTSKSSSGELDLQVPALSREWISEAISGAEQFERLKDGSFAYSPSYTRSYTAVPEDLFRRELLIDRGGPHAAAVLSWRATLQSGSA
jgi:hypothetical protein